MSERPYADGIGAVRELRPSEDLSLLHAYELRRVFEAETVASLELIEPAAIAGPESFRPISAPLPSGSSEPARPAQDDPIRPQAASRLDRSDGAMHDRKPEAPAVREAEVPRRDWLLQPEPLAAPVDAQPYGDDPARVRDLVQFFADGRAGSASVIVQRAAGDLVEGASAIQERPLRLRTVTATGRAG